LRIRAPGFAAALRSLAGRLPFTHFCINTQVFPVRFLGVAP
jgi:hypothetical protein